MSAIHILSGDDKGRWTAIFHLAVPNINNNVSINYRTALLNSGLGGSTQMAEGAEPGQIPTAELAQIESGAVYEHSVNFLAESGGTAPADMRTALRAEYAKCESAVIAGLQRRLKYFGYTEDKA